MKKVAGELLQFTVLVVIVFFGLVALDGVIQSQGGKVSGSLSDLLQQISDAIKNAFSDASADAVKQAAQAAKDAAKDAAQQAVQAGKDAVVSPTPDESTSNALFKNPANWFTDGSTGSWYDFLFDPIKEDLSGNYWPSSDDSAPGGPFEDYKGTIDGDAVTKAILGSNLF